MARAALSRAQSVAAQAKAQRDRLREDLAMLNGSIGTLAEEGIEERLDEVRGRLSDAEARAARYAADSITRRGAQKSYASAADFARFEAEHEARP